MKKSYFKDRVSEQEQSNKLIFHNGLISEKHEILDSFPVADEPIIAADIGFEDRHIVFWRMSQVKIVFTECLIQIN